ncbi:hypothetical protein J6590_022628 [Homalodisca vitripennis]|nr:hypothetical protein J6590_022628 [Homalodisca vitripennis]
MPEAEVASGTSPGGQWSPAGPVSPEMQLMPTCQSRPAADQLKLHLGHWSDRCWSLSPHTTSQDQLISLYLPLIYSLVRPLSARLSNNPIIARELYVAVSPHDLLSHEVSESVMLPVAARRVAVMRGGVERRVRRQARKSEGRYTTLACASRWTVDSSEEDKRQFDAGMSGGRDRRPVATP